MLKDGQPYSTLDPPPSPQRCKIRLACSDNKAKSNEAAELALWSTSPQQSKAISKAAARKATAD